MLNIQLVAFKLMIFTHNTSLSELMCCKTVLRFSKLAVTNSARPLGTNMSFEQPGGDRVLCLSPSLRTNT